MGTAQPIHCPNICRRSVFFCAGTVYRSAGRGLFRRGLFVFHVETTTTTEITRRHFENNPVFNYINSPISRNDGNHGNHELNFSKTTPDQKQPPFGAPSVTVWDEWATRGQTSLDEPAATPVGFVVRRERRSLKLPKDETRRIFKVCSTL